MAKSKARLPYKSKFEEQTAKDLKRLKAGARYEPFKLDYEISEKHKYLPDWVLPNGTILEAKGKLDLNTRKKMLAVKKAHPKLKICFIFQNAYNKIYRGSETTYADWATKEGFPWSHKYVKVEWLEN